MPRRKPPREPQRQAARDSFAVWEGRLTVTEHRIDQIVQKMQSGAWLSGVSDRALCKEWNLSPDRMKQLVVEASRVVRKNLRDDPDARAEAKAAIVQTFEVIRAKAMAKGDPASLRVALDATRALGFYMGVEPVKRLDVTQREDDPFDGWSEAELDAYAKDGKRPRRALRQLATELTPDGGGEPEPVH